MLISDEDESMDNLSNSLVDLDLYEEIGAIKKEIIFKEETGYIKKGIGAIKKEIIVKSNQSNYGHDNTFAIEKGENIDCELELFFF